MTTESEVSKLPRGCYESSVSWRDQWTTESWKIQQDEDRVKFSREKDHEELTTLFYAYDFFPFSKFRYREFSPPSASWQNAKFLRH